MPCSTSVGVIITTNHKTDGIYLPPDDRRHFVAWSNLTKDRFPDDYWRKLYRWYDNGGESTSPPISMQLDLSDFDAKAPPPKTQAFWEIVNANRAPENADLSDALDVLEWPAAITVSDLISRADRRILPRGFATARTLGGFLTGSKTVPTSLCAMWTPRTSFGGSMVVGRSSTPRPTCRFGIRSPPPIGVPVVSEVSDVSDLPMHPSTLKTHINVPYQSQSVRARSAMENH